MNVNLVTYDIDGSVGFPEVGLLEPSPISNSRMCVTRFIQPIKDRREEIINQSVRKSYQDGFCIVHLFREDTKPDRKLDQLKFYARKIFGSVIESLDPTFGDSFFYVQTSSSNCEEICQLIKILLEHKMFVIFFSKEPPRPIEINWHDVYKSGHFGIGKFLIGQETAFFRTNLRSQDYFELSVVKLTNVDGQPDDADPGGGNVHP